MFVNLMKDPLKKTKKKLTRPYENGYFVRGVRNAVFKWPRHKNLILNIIRMELFNLECNDFTSPSTETICLR